MAVTFTTPPLAPVAVAWPLDGRVCGNTRTKGTGVAMVTCLDSNALLFMPPDAVVLDDLAVKLTATV